MVDCALFDAKREGPDNGIDHFSKHLLDLAHNPFQQELQQDFETKPHQGLHPIRVLYNSMKLPQLDVAAMSWLLLLRQQSNAGHTLLLLVAMCLYARAACRKQANESKT